MKFRTAFCVGMSILLSAPVTADDSTVPHATARQSLIRDVALRHQAVRFRVVHIDGSPIIRQPVSVMYGDQIVAKAISNDDGEVQIQKLRAGLHQVTVAGQSHHFRLWNQDAAPHGALQVPALIVDSEQIRGQAASGLFAPAVIATGVAVTAVAIALVGKSSSSNVQPLPASP